MPTHRLRRIRSGRRIRGHLSRQASAPTGPRLTQIADEAVTAFREQVLGTRCGAGPDADASVRVVVRTPGAISDSARLVVWVLLGDVDEEWVPSRWDPTEVIADPELTGWALTLRAAVIGHLIALDWPDPEHVTVRFDTADRVERRGGRSYVAA